MGAYLTVSDLSPFGDIPTAKAEALIDDAETFAVQAAPCLSDPSSLTEQQRKLVRTVLRRAVLREADSATGAKTQETAGIYSYTVDTRRAASASFLLPEEEDILRGICGGDAHSTAFSIDMNPRSTSMHYPWCNVMFGSALCSCGVSIAGYPIYEGGELC